MPDLRLAAEFRRRSELALPGRVAKVVLFGSRARGGARPDSDWDIAIFLKGSFKAEDQWTLSDTAFDLMAEFNHTDFIRRRVLRHVSCRLSRLDRKRRFGAENSFRRSRPVWSDRK